MADHRLVAGTGTSVGGDTSGSTVAPAQPAILSVTYADGPLDAQGKAQKRVAVVIEDPEPIGTTVAYRVYLDAPDTAGAIVPADGSAAADGSQGSAGSFKPFDKGTWQVGEPITFDHVAPSVIEYWRVYVVPVSERRELPVVQSGQPGESVNRQFVVLPPLSPGDGREFAPLVLNPRLATADDFTAFGVTPWSSNPLQQTVENGKQVLRVAIAWDWPTGDHTLATLGGVNVVSRTGVLQTYHGNVSRQAPAFFISQDLEIPAGTTAWTFYLESYDVNGQRNSQIDGITPAVSFNYTRALGSAGQEYAALVTADGVHPLVAVTPLTGADGTSLLEVVSWAARPADPRFKGFELWIKALPSGVAQPYGAATISAGAASGSLILHVSQPATVVTWRFYLVSIDVANGRNSVVDGVTPSIDISVGNANGQLNLSKAKTGTFDVDEFQSLAGVFTLKSLSATKILTGILQVGGGGNKVSIMRNFDTLGALIGWVGDDSASSGYVGAWFKELRVGGSSPGSSAADQIRVSSGVVTIGSNITLLASQIGVGYPTSFLTGLIVNGQLDTGIALAKLASGTLPGGIVYAGTIAATQILAGTISVALTLTAPTIVVTSPGNWVVNIDATNAIKVSDPSVSTLNAQMTPGTLVCSDSTGAISYGRATTTYFGSGAVTRLQISRAGFLEIFDTGGLSQSRALLGITSGHGYLALGNSSGTSYALMTGTAPRKMLWGTATLSSGTVNISTGLSVIEGAVATLIISGQTSGEVLGVGASGGTLTVTSSNGSSSQQISYMVAGQP